MSTATAVVFLPQSLADTGVLPLTSASFWTFQINIAREMARKHTAFYNIGFSEAQSLVQTEACTQMGSRNCSGMGDSSPGSPEDFVVFPSSAGGNSSFELHSQSTEERATLGRYHHFHGHSGMCA